MESWRNILNTLFNIWFVSYTPLLDIQYWALCGRGHQTKRAFDFTWWCCYVLAFSHTL